MKVGFGRTYNETLHPSPIVVTEASFTYVVPKESPSCLLPSLERHPNETRLVSYGDDGQHSLVNSDNSTSDINKARCLSITTHEQQPVLLQQEKGEIPQQKSRRAALLRRVMKKCLPNRRGSGYIKRKRQPAGANQSGLAQDVSVLSKDEVMRRTGLRSISPVHSSKRHRFEF